MAKRALLPCTEFFFFLAFQLGSAKSATFTKRLLWVSGGEPLPPLLPRTTNQGLKVTPKAAKKSRKASKPRAWELQRSRRSSISQQIHSCQHSRPKSRGKPVLVVRLHLVFKNRVLGR